MTWLEQHVREFVIPGIRTLNRREGRETHDRDIKPFNGTVRPSSKCRFKEAGMIHAAVSSVVPKGNVLREVALGLCEQVGKPGDHQFVYELDTQNRVRDLSNHYPGMNGADVLHSFLGSTARALRGRLQHKDARVIYPGRDVWAFEVMSKRVGVPSVYDPRVSREIDEHGYAFKGVVNAWGIPDWSKALAFDSGYAGTVPRAIGRVAGVHEINIVMLSAKDVNFQVFPGHTGSRAKALALEYLAKYRKRCLVREREPYQPLADLEEFIKAALLTIWIWHHVSPKRMPSWQKQVHRKEKRRKGSINWANGGGITYGGPSLTVNPSQWAGSSIVASNTTAIQTLQIPITTNTIDPFTVFTSATGATTTAGNFFVDTNTFNLTGNTGTGGLI